MRIRRKVYTVDNGPQLSDRQETVFFCDYMRWIWIQNRPFREQEERPIETDNDND
jgi:hypothetical protein